MKDIDTKRLERLEVLARAEGARVERQRIRRALKPAAVWLRQLTGEADGAGQAALSDRFRGLTYTLDYATRAPKRSLRPGKEGT